MSKPLFSLLAMVAAFGGPALAQDGTVSTQDPNKVFTGKPLPGTIAGTERWIVHFKTRPFDLSALTAEYHGARNVDKIAGIVRDLESKVEAHQKGFVADVVALGGRVFKQYWIANCAAMEIAPKHLATIKKLANVDFLQPDRVPYENLSKIHSRSRLNLIVTQEKGPSYIFVGNATSHRRTHWAKRLPWARRWETRTVP